MKIIIAVLLLSTSMLASPKDLKVVSIGPDPFCHAYSSSPQCAAPLLSIFIEMKIAASGPDVLAFRYRIKYTSNGEQRESVGIVNRGDDAAGYTATSLIQLPYADQVIEVAVDELVVK